MLLEQENLHLQAELQSTLNQEDENRSDLSDTITEQHKELVQTIQQKNKQISQLLSDVEVIYNIAHYLFTYLQHYVENKTHHKLIIRFLENKNVY